MSRHPAYRGPWQTVRKRILERDNHTCQIRGPKCTTTATHVDHIIPTLKGGAWYDPDNLRAACKNCNLGRIDRTNRDRWQTANTHITLIVGPPGAGKTTHVQQHAQPGDLIIDYDQLADAITNTGRQKTGGGTKTTGGTKTAGGHTHGSPLHQATMAARNALLKTLREGKAGVAQAWIISANPKAETIFPYHRVVVVDPGKEEVLRRIEQSKRPVHWIKLVNDWYKDRSGEPADQSNQSSRRW